MQNYVPTWKSFICSKASRWFLGHIQHPIQWVPVASFPGLKDRSVKLTTYFISLECWYLITKRTSGISLTPLWRARGKFVFAVTMWLRNLSWRSLERAAWSCFMLIFHVQINQCVIQVWELWFVWLSVAMCVVEMSCTIGRSKLNSERLHSMQFAVRLILLVIIRDSKICVTCSMDGK
jgi:hypothetical protein